MAHCSPEDVDDAVGAARAAYKTWRDVAPLERARLLRQLATVVRDNAQALAMIDAADCGNPYSAMLGDAAIAAAQLDFFAGLVTEMKGASIPMGPGVVNYSLREPLGVVAKILPFNHPFMFCAGKIAAPLAAGNTVVVKPPEQAPLSSLRFAELIDGLLPPGVFNLLPGGADAGEALVRHRHVAMVSVIGGVNTGRAVMRAAADRVKPLLLELGGKNALIAFADADPDAVAAGIVAGMNFAWCGQSCGSTSRAFLHKDIHDAVLERLSVRLKDMRPGLPTDPNTRMGAIISRQQRDRILALIESARSEGARLITGGGPPADPALRHGFYIEPTVFAGVTPEHAHRARGDLRPGLGGARVERRGGDAGGGERRRLRPHLLDLDQRPRRRAPGRHISRGRLRVDQRVPPSTSSAPPSAAPSSPASAARNASASSSATPRRRTSTCASAPAERTTSSPPQPGTHASLRKARWLIAWMRAFAGMTC